jgi:2-phospho-L-lactate guanylyltransferase
VTCWIVVPIKAPDACKTRLSGVLDARERRELVAQMLHHVFAVASQTAGVDDVLVLGPSRHGLPASTPLLDDPGQGLNASLAGAARTAAKAGVGRLVFVSADLPLVTHADLAALVAVPPASAAIAADRARAGTNALSLPGAQAPHFGLHYGVDSFLAHLAEARRINLDLREIRSDTLALDIDVPADLEALAALVRYPTARATG